MHNHGSCSIIHLPTHIATQGDLQVIWMNKLSSGEQFVVRTNLGLGFNICVSLGMCMGPRMKKNMILRTGRSSITALSLADLSLAVLRLTALSLAPISLEISIRILLLPDKQKAVSRSAQARNKLLVAKHMAAALNIRMSLCMSLGMCIGLRMNMNMMGRTL